MTSLHTTHTSMWKRSSVSISLSRAERWNAARSHNLMRFSKGGNPATPASVPLAIGSVVSQRHYGINLEGATCRQIAGGQCNQKKQ